jgi:hypothetical protein
MMPVFFTTLSQDLGNDFDVQIDSDEVAECTNELAESFVAFVQGRYVEASEVKFYCQKTSILRSLIFLFL